MEKLRAVEREGLKTDIPAFAPGDTLRVMVRVREGEKERLQAFEGICIARRGGGINETFTVRKISAGGGREGGFPPDEPWGAGDRALRGDPRRRGELVFFPLPGAGTAPVLRKARVTPPDGGGGHEAAQ